MPTHVNAFTADCILSTYQLQACFRPKIELWELSIHFRRRRGIESINKAHVLLVPLPMDCSCTALEFLRSLSRMRMRRIFCEGFSLRPALQNSRVKMLWLSNSLKRDHNARTELPS